MLENKIRSNVVKIVIEIIYAGLPDQDVNLE